MDRPQLALMTLRAVVDCVVDRLGDATLVPLPARVECFDSHDLGVPVDAGDSGPVIADGADISRDDSCRGRCHPSGCLSLRRSSSRSGRRDKGEPSCVEPQAQPPDATGAITSAPVMTPSPLVSAILPGPG